MILIIVGGIHYPAGGYEFNTMNDRHAFNVVMKSSVPCWVLPEEVYATMQAGMAELFHRLLDCGDLGRYLVGTHKKNSRYHAACRSRYPPWRRPMITP